MDENLSVNNLKIHFPIKKGIFGKTVGNVYAVNGVSFKVYPGKTLGLVGESGCGKSTVGLGIMGLLKPTSGEIFFNGKPIPHKNYRRQKSFARNIQMIFQDPYSSLNPRFTVRQILSDPIDIHKLYKGTEKNDRIAYFLKKVGISPDCLNRYAHEFSGGQRQRIGIARALILNPSLIIGDEPVSALDVSIQAQIINLLIELQQEFGLSYIIIAHDLAVIEYLCDTVAVMYLGKIVEIGKYEDIYQNSKHPYTRALLSAVPIPDNRKRNKRIVLEGDVPNPIDLPAGCYFHPRCPNRMAICEKTPPKLKSKDNNHKISCHLYNY